MLDKKQEFRINISVYLQRSCGKKYAGTGNCLRLEPHKHIGPQTIIHIVPIKTKNRETKT